MAIASKIGAEDYLECSAKSNEGVCEVFHFATRVALGQSNGGRIKHKCVVL
jgi:Ras homolog gene family, member A